MRANVGILKGQTTSEEARRQGASEVCDMMQVHVL
jgi:hypothetical protein